MKSFRKFSQRKENRDYMNQEESVYELNRIQRYIMQMRPLLKKNLIKICFGVSDYHAAFQRIQDVRIFCARFGNDAAVI